MDRNNAGTKMLKDTIKQHSVAKTEFSANFSTKITNVVSWIYMVQKGGGG